MKFFFLCLVLLYQTVLPQTTIIHRRGSGTVVTANTGGANTVIMTTYYNNWQMGSDGQWSLGQPWYLSTKTYAGELGNTNIVILFMGYEICKSDFSPYLSISKTWHDNGGSVADSLDFLYNGSGNPGDGTLAAWNARGTIPQLIDSLHAKGKRFLACLQAVNATVGWNYVVSDSARTEVMTREMVRYAQTHNIDGWDINVEAGISTDSVDHERFFRILRRNGFPGMLITIVPPVTQPTLYSINSMQYIDFTQPQCYAYVMNWQGDGAGCSDPNSKNGVFLKAPLHLTGVPANSNHQDMTTWGPELWTARGWPKSKIVVLLSNEANPYSGATNNDQLFSCAGWNSHFWGDTVAYYMKNFGGTYTFDPSYPGAYIHGTATATVSTGNWTISSGEKFIIPVFADANLDSIFNHFKPLGFRNYGFYDISTDTRTPDPTGYKNPRHKHMSDHIND